MKCLQAFLVGIFISGVIGGLWWLMLVAGLFTILVRRSYFILSIGVILDLWFSYNGIPGFYTGFFLVITILVEYFRKHLFWTS